MAWSLLPDGTVDFVNQRWLEYTGLSVEEALADSNRVVHPEDFPRVMEKWLTQMAVGKQGEDEMRLRRADGEYRWFLIRTVPLLDQQGNIVKWYGTSTDIEDRKRTADALRESEEKFRQLAENIQEVFWMTTPAMDELLYASTAYERIWGRSLESLRQRPRSFMDAIHSEDRAHAIDILEGQRKRGFEVEYRVVRPDGSVRWIRDRGFPVKNQTGEVYRVAGIAEDITERKHAENALRDSGVQLQALTRRLVELQESERKDLARELHDRVGQSLTALNINLAILRDGLLRHDIGMRSRLQDSVTLVESTSQTIQNVASDLRPPMLDDYGLPPAIRWYAEQFSARTGVAISVRAGAPDERAAADVEIALFRIAQEALNNVAKHARAKSVVIALECQGSEYVMSVVDDGMGFRAADERADRPRPKLGMVTMRERAQAVGGRLRIEPRPGGGTQLTVRVPK
jgi:two-component system sensor histidine kinase UhpB